MMRALRAEALKALTLPANHITLAATLIGALALMRADDPVTYLQAGFIVLGVIAATSEHNGGQLRTTLVALPRRVTTHLAKLLVLMAFALPTALVVSAGDTVHLVCTALLAAAVATIVRSTIPALAGLLICYYIAVPVVREHVEPPEHAVVGWALVAVVASTSWFRLRDA